MSRYTGAGQSVGAVEKSMTALLKKISQITVGENGERAVHCSAGCAVEVPGKDTYETLFKRADVALYQVKRGSKNNFAFYVPEMEQEDYEFRSKILLSGRDEKKFALPELQHFLDAVIYFYQMVLLVDVSGNVYHIMEEVRDGVFSKVPSFGSLDEFVELAARGIHGDDLDGYFDHLARPALLRAYQAGESGVRHCFRFYDGQRYRWVECQAMFYVDEQDKVCDITLLRWLDGEPGSNE